MTRDTEIFRSRSIQVRGALASLCVFALLWTLRSLGWLQPLELALYDQLISLRAPAQPHPARVAIVSLEEPDIRELDYPLPDRTLAQLLRRIAADQPRAIGIDLYRDLPEPRDGSGQSELHAVLAEFDNIVPIFLPGSIEPPPATLRLAAQQNADWIDWVGSNEFPRDGKITRRGLLYTEYKRPDGSSTQATSLAMQLTLQFLARQNPAIVPEPTPDGALKLGAAILHPLQPTDGAYQIRPAASWGARADFAGTGGFQFLLDFRSPPPPTLRVADVLAGRFAQGSFRDKVVLLGVRAPSVRDQIATPLRSDLPGVELHASAVNQLLATALDGTQPLRFWSTPAEFCWLLGFTLLGGLLGLAVCNMTRFLIVLAFFTSLILGITYWLFLHNLWVPGATPLLGLLLAAITLDSFVAGSERQARRQLFSIFARNVSPQVASALVAQSDAFADGGRPRSQKLTATILFTDLEGFSTVSEGMEPAVLMDWLNELMEATAKEVETNGGVILKYIGDAIMGAFGVPVPRSHPSEIANDAANAVRAALRMGDAITTVNTRFVARGLPPVRMRIGIFTGDLVAGCLGAASRLEYTVIGDVVNTAARLESWNKDYKDTLDPVGNCRILIGESTHALVKDIFRSKPVATVELKGKEHSTSIYRVLPASSNPPNSP